MVTREQVAAAAAEARDASFEFILARACVGAAYEREEALADSPDKGGEHGLSPCAAAGAAVMAGVDAAGKYTRLAALVQEYAATITDPLERQTMMLNGARMQKNAVRIQQRLCMDSAMFVLDCADLAEQLGIVVLAATGGRGTDGPV
jgi:hypothetical protein